MGLVESRQGSGIYVQISPSRTVTHVLTLVGSASPRSVEELFEMREELEGFATGLACQRRTSTEADQIVALAERSSSADDPHVFGNADTDFHLVIHRAAGNAYVAETLRAIRDMQSDVLALFTSVAGSIDVASQHHLQIARAVLDQDTEAAISMMRLHVRYTADRVAELLVNSRQLHAKEGGVTQANRVSRSQTFAHE
jgi:DNA-binding FadR family transcriptional regulator